MVYFLVLWSHSLRHRFGPVHFYALIGGITAIMSWVTGAGVFIQSFWRNLYRVPSCATGLPHNRATIPAGQINSSQENLRVSFQVLCPI